MELRQYVTIVKRWWWLVALFTLVAATTSFAVSRRQQPVYQATTTIMVGQSIQAVELSRSDIETSEVLAETYANLAQRQPVLQGAVDNLGLTSTWQALKKRVKARPVTGTQLVEITVEASSPEVARLTADEVARQLILLSPTAVRNRERAEEQRFVRQRIEELQAKIQTGQERVRDLEARLSGPLSTQEVTELQGEINTLESLIADWDNTYTQLLFFVETERSANYLSVIEPAQVSYYPIRPRPGVDTLLAAVVGCLLSLGTIFLLEYLDVSLKSTDDLGQVLGLAALGAVGHVKGKHEGDRLITLQDPLSPASEAYRIIRSNIWSLDRSASSVLITSAGFGEGKSVTAANLGVVMAQAGLKTIVVDADLRQPAQHRIFRLSNASGLTDLLRSPESEIGDCLRDTGVENLQIITSGMLVHNPSELLASQRSERLLAGLRELADCVILDSPPVLAVSETIMVAQQVDAVVLVARAGHTQRDAARQALLSLEQAGARVLGGVLNRVQDGRWRYGNPLRYAGAARDERESGDLVPPARQLTFSE